jgi:hypothetical protein
MHTKRAPAETFYGLLLRLYPRDYQARFASEMAEAFARAAGERRGRGQGAYRFLLAECLGLVAGAGAEWFAKWTTDPWERGRSLPDIRMMRPPGISCEVWFADAGRGSWKTGD